MFNIFKKVKNKGNTPKQDYNLSYDNLAIPEIHKGDSDDEDVDISSDMITDDNNDKTHVTYDSVAGGFLHSVLLQCNLLLFQDFS